MRYVIICILDKQRFMRVRFIPIVAVVLLTLFWSDAAPAQPLPIPRQPDMSADLQRYHAEVLREYNAVIGDWRQAWARGDARATARFYTEDASFIPPNGAQIQGRDAIERYFRENLSPGGEIRLGVVDFAASGSLAYAQGRYWLQPDAADQSTAVFGTYMAVMRREGRTWRIRAQMFVGDDEGVLE